MSICAICGGASPQISQICTDVQNKTAEDAEYAEICGAEGLTERRARMMLVQAAGAAGGTGKLRSMKDEV